MAVTWRLSPAHASGAPRPPASEEVCHRRLTHEPHSHYPNSGRQLRRLTKRPFGSLPGRNRSRADSDKRTERSKLRPRPASAAEWLVGEAEPRGIRWSSHEGRRRKFRGTAHAGRCIG